MVVQLVIVPFYYVVLGTLSESTREVDSLLFWRGKGMKCANNSRILKSPTAKKRSFFLPPTGTKENTGGSSFLGEDQAPLSGRSVNGTNGITRAISSNDGEDISDRFKSNGNQ